jgi:hypothetical protein
MLPLTYAKGNYKNVISTLCRDLRRVEPCLHGATLHNPRNRELQCIFVESLDINIADIRNVWPSSLVERRQRSGRIIFNIHHGEGLRY